MARFDDVNKFPFGVVKPLLDAFNGGHHVGRIFS